MRKIRNTSTGKPKQILPTKPKVKRAVPVVMGKRVGPAVPSRNLVAKPQARKAPPKPSVDFKRQGARLSRLARR